MHSDEASLTAFVSSCGDFARVNQPRFPVPLGTDSVEGPLAPDSSSRVSWEIWELALTQLITFVSVSVESCQVDTAPAALA